VVSAPVSFLFDEVHVSEPCVWVLLPSQLYYVLLCLLSSTECEEAEPVCQVILVLFVKQSLLKFCSQLPLFVLRSYTVSESIGVAVIVPYSFNDETKRLLRVGIWRPSRRVFCLVKWSVKLLTSVYLFVDRKLFRRSKHSHESIIHKDKFLPRTNHEGPNGE
jgi:hypothetical protein